jgi:hypothetical protein
MEEDSTDDPAHRARVKAGMALYETTGMVRYFQHGGQLGLTFDHYVDYFYREITTLDAQKAAKMLKTIGLFANLTGEAFETKAGETLNVIFGDPNKAIQVGRALRALPEVGDNHE